MGARIDSECNHVYAKLRVIIMMPVLDLSFVGKSLQFS